MYFRNTLIFLKNKGIIQLNTCFEGDCTTQKSRRLPHTQRYKKTPPLTLTNIDHSILTPLPFPFL